jgi:hypothetical protein
MTRPTLATSSSCSILLAALVCASPLGCHSSGDSSGGEASPASAAAAPAVEASEAPAELALDEAPELEVPAAESPAAAVPAIEEQPVLASTAPVLPETPRRPRSARAPDSLRSPSLLPADTPEAHVAAFTELPVTKRDKAPVGGVGASGIHLDELEVGKGWASSRCEDLGSQFVADVDTRVNVCFRVVHPREAEAVTLEWARAGKVRQVIEVGVRPTHAYLTRAWLPVTAGRAGEWTATIKSADGSVLGRVEFEIAK